MIKSKELKKISGYNGQYLISKEGDIYSNVKNKYLKPTLNTRGYFVVTLSKKTRPVHQLLVETFIDKDYKEKKLVVDHKDKNPKNNKLNNLRVATKSENGINVDRPFKMCIFQRKNGTFRVIHKGKNKTFKTFNHALEFRISLQDEK